MYSVEQGLAGDATTQWKYVDGAECSVVDDTTFILGLTETHPTMINMLANIAMLTVIDESSVEANGGYEACQRDPKCNTGAYNLVEWKNGEKITLERNENYWGEPGYYKTIEFTFVNDSAARVMSLSSGQINVAVNLTGADVLSVSDPDVVESVATGGCYVIFMNVNNEYLSNELVREAIFYAVDVNAMNQVGTTGLNQLASSLVPTSNAYYVAPDSSYDHTVDLDKAKELLAQAGYPDGFDLYMPIMAGQQSECEVLQACLLQIGINLKLEVVELPVFLAATDTGDLDFSYQRTTPDDIINMVNYFDDRLEPMSRGGGIIGGFAEMYDMIDGCRYATDETESAAYWKEFQDYTRDNYLYIPVYEDCFFSAMDGSYTFQNDQIGYINFATMRPVG
jgi:peptide/nickel transport system substrate-binding protein